jgi:hypothetical protein
MSAAVKVGSFVGTHGTRAVLGTGYALLRVAYKLGEAGEAAIASSEVEVERLGKKHAELMALEDAAAIVRRAELQTRLAQLRAAAAAPAPVAAAPMVPVAA